eukprot:TRINITY_DN7593_c0_g1_i2.p1 TRINITY_DN7593_c0_g1~~TRINITY_DN7593_c0_g1_i2.p1  ORF type:complete len:1010 (-),score=355.74 TRINITY_DN7593_c0_g1_i2:9-3038(-)
MADRTQKLQSLLAQKGNIVAVGTGTSSAMGNTLGASMKPGGGASTTTNNNSTTNKTKQPLRGPGIVLTEALDLEKIIKLMTHKHSKDLRERHTRAIKRIAKLYDQGLLITDLPNIVIIIEKLYDFVLKGVDACYLDSLCLLIDCCALPFIQENTSDAVVHYEDIVALIATIASLLQSGIAVLQTHVANMISSFVNRATVNATISKGGNGMNTVRVVGKTGSTKPKPPKGSKRGNAGQPTTSSSLAETNGLNKTALIEKLVTPKTIQLSKQELQKYSGVVFHQLNGVNNHMILFESGAVELVVEALRYLLIMGKGRPKSALGNTDDDNDDPETVESSLSETQVALIRCVRDCSYFDSTGDQLISCSALEVLPKFLNVTSNVHDPVVYCILEACWNLLDMFPSMAASELSSVVSVTAFKDMLVNLMDTGNSNNDKKLRNQVMVILTLVVYNNPDLVDRCMEPDGLLDLACAASIGTATGKTHTHVPHFMNTNSNEDFLFVQLCVNMMYVFALHSSEALEVMLDQDLVTFLVGLLDEEQRANQRWTNPQMEMMRHTAINFVQTFMVSNIDYFMSEDGPGILVDFAKLSYERSDWELTIAAVHAVSRLSPVCQTLFASEGAIEFLLETFAEANPHELRCHSINAITELCTMNQDNQDILRESNGIKMIANTLRVHEIGATDKLMSEDIAVRALDCLKCAVIGNTLSETALIVADGVDALLDCLEHAPQFMQASLVAALSDLLLNNNALEHFLSWRSDGEFGIGPCQMLLDLWRSEEKRLGIHNENGVLTNVNEPLKPTGSREKFVYDTRYDNSVSIISRQMLETMWEVDLRMKLFALFTVIGFDNLVSNEDVSWDAQICIPVIERYMAFRMGEVWSDMFKEMKEENFRPTSPDQERINGEIVRGYREALDVAHSQSQINEMRREEEKDLEAEFFQMQLNSVKIATEKQGFKEMAARQKLAKKAQQAKREKMEMLKQSRTAIKTSANLEMMQQEKEREMFLDEEEEWEEGEESD